MSVIWHDLECGGYAEDLELWRSLATGFGDPVLDVGAGTGRVTLDLARRGHHVTALDRDAVLLEELSRRAAGLEVTTVLADAREFRLRERFALCVVPMQTIQLLGGVAGRRAFLLCARRHLRDGAALAVAISETVDLYEIPEGAPGPFPDMRELDGVVYSSRPTAVRADRGGFVLERRRETIAAGGEHTIEQDSVRLDRLTCDRLEEEARAVGMRPVERASIDATSEYVGSMVVILHA